MADGLRVAGDLLKRIMNEAPIQVTVTNSSVADNDSIAIVIVSTSFYIPLAFNFRNRPAASSLALHTFKKSWWIFRTASSRCFLSLFVTFDAYFPKTHIIRCYLNKMYLRGLKEYFCKGLCGGLNASKRLSFVVFLSTCQSLDNCEHLKLHINSWMPKYMFLSYSTSIFPQFLAPFTFKLVPTPVAVSNCYLSRSPLNWPHYIVLTCTVLIFKSYVYSYF